MKINHSICSTQINNLRLEISVKSKLYIVNPASWCIMIYDSFYNNNKCTNSIQLWLTDIIIRWINKNLCKLHFKTWLHTLLGWQFVVKVCLFKLSDSEIAQVQIFLLIILPSFWKLIEKSRMFFKNTNFWVDFLSEVWPNLIPCIGMLHSIAALS